MEYVYGTSVIGGVERENLKIVGGPALREGEYLTTVREYDDSSITDRCRIDRHYHSDTDEGGTRYDFYTISEHYRYVERTKLMEETRKATEIAFVTLAESGSRAGISGSAIRFPLRRSDWCATGLLLPSPSGGDGSRGASKRPDREPGALR